MKKKIIALAIAAALTIPALALAAADATPEGHIAGKSAITVYGQANLSVDMVNDGAATNSVTTNRLVSNTSRIGVKGSEALGGDLSAVWQIEGTVAMDTGITTTTDPQTTKLFDRNTFLGLSSATMGTALLGRHDTPYKISTRNLDVFADTVAADNRYNGLMGNGIHDARLANVIAYISPAMSGLTVAAATVFGAETATGTAKKGSALSLAGMFKQGPIYATLAYQTITIGSAGTGDLGAGFLGAVVNDKASAFKLGGSYSMDAFAVNAVVEKISFKTALTGNDTTNTNIYLAGKFNISSTDAVKLALTKRGDTTTAGTTATNNATQVAVGYDHGMSKDTSVYALYTKITQNTTGAADPSTLSFGIKHSF